MADNPVFSTVLIPQEIKELAKDFSKTYNPIESQNGNKALLNKDEKSQAFYVSCHIKACDFLGKMDFEASIDGSDEEELYKLNRDITENKAAFNNMVTDAKGGRSFEDIVIEFDKTYNPLRPLKIYGGQHRIKAIEAAQPANPNILHGFRVYFGLSKEQKVEIATINNTSITVSSDLLDRMKEQLIGSELRDFCQTVGLLSEGEDFADKKDPNLPTVRIARTFVVNFYKGKAAEPEQFHMPILCKSGGVDDDYQTIRQTINWNDPALLDAGKQFAKLHQTQKAKVHGRSRDKNNEFARKAFSLTVVASWSYAVGHFAGNKSKQSIIFGLCESLGKDEDPLNAKALSEACLKGIDPDTYRGLGARNSPDELGRMLEVFFVLVDDAKEKKLSKNLANAAIQSYEAKKSTHNAKKMKEKL